MKYSCTVLVFFLLLSSGFGGVIAKSQEPSIGEEPNIANFQNLPQIAEKVNTVFEEEESTVFDLYLSDQFKGSILVKYTEGWFEVEEPSDIIEQLSELKKTDDVLKLVSGRIYKARSIENVGSVRYDLNTFRVILSLAPSLLPTQQIQLLNRLPDPENKFSLQQKFLVSTAGNFENSLDEEGAFTHRTLASVGKYYTKFDGTSAKNQTYRLYEAGVGGVVGDYQFDTGYLQSTGQAFVASAPYVGAHIETSTDILLDQDLLHGSQFEIFVPSRAKVEFYRDGRLLGVQVLDFGLQQIDTRAFPEGSYDVDIVMTESNGIVTRDRRFFTKSSFLPIGDKPIFSAQGGLVRDQLDVMDIPIYQFGARWRAYEIFQLNTSLYGTNKRSVVEVGGLGLYRGVTFGSGLNVSNKKDVGVTGSVSGQILGFGVSASGAQSLRNTEPNNAKDIDPLATHPTQLISFDRSSWGASISRTFGEMSLRYTYDRNKRTLFNPLTIGSDSGYMIDEEGDPVRPDEVTLFKTDRYVYGPIFDWRIYSDNRKSVAMQLSHLNTDIGKQLNALLFLRYALDPKVSVSSTGRMMRSDPGDINSVVTSLNYDNIDKGGTGTRLQLVNDESRRNGTEDEDLVYSNQVFAENTDRYLKTNIFARNNEIGDLGDTGVAINGESAFLLTEDGSVSVSYPPREGAAMIAEIDSKTTNSDIEIVLNDQVYDTVKAGEKKVVGVPAFKSYTIRIRPSEQADLVDYDSTEYSATLFPGNIIKRKWSVERVYILLGRLVDENGSPIPIQRIRGTREYTVTEVDGSFQGEVSGKERLYVESSKYKCTLQANFPEPKDVTYFVDLGDVKCIPTEKKKETGV